LPNCGYLKNYSIKVEQNQLIISLSPEGYIDVCNLIERAFPEAKCTMREDKTLFLEGQIIAISGSSFKQNELKQFLDSLRSCLTIDTSLDECHALSPRSLPPTEDGSEWKRTKMGELVYRAKYRGNSTLASVIAVHIAKFIVAHPRYRRAEFVVAAPRSLASSTFDLPAEMVRRIATTLGKSVAVAEKTRRTHPQKELWKQGDIERLKANVKGSMVIRTSLVGGSVILVDETMGSGATLEELGRACRVAGAVEVLGIAAAKNAKFTFGIDLSEGPWHEH